MRIAIIAAALLLVGAAPQKKETGEVARGAEDSSALTSQVTQPVSLPPGTNLVVYRHRAFPLLWAPMLKVDGKKIASLGEKTYTALQLPPGKHFVVLDWPRFSGHDDPSLFVMIEQDKVVVLEVSAGIWGNSYTSSINTHAVSALTEVAACCKFKPPQP